MRFPLIAPAAIVFLLCGCRTPWSGSGSPHCADTARLDFPVDLAAFADSGTVWPHGVHGGPHPEGHPGIDLLLRAEGGEIVVRSPYAAEVAAVQAESSMAGNSCIVLDSACVQVNFCHVRLDAGLAPGARVARGQRLGTVGREFDGGPLALHFGTYLGMDADQVCPADLISGEDAGLLDSLLARSSYAEDSAHQVTLKCLNGTSETFSFPAERALCNPRADAQTRKRMEDCLGPACAGIW